MTSRRHRDCTMVAGRRSRESRHPVRAEVGGSLRPGRVHSSPAFRERRFIEPPPPASRAAGATRARAGCSRPPGSPHRLGPVDAALYARQRLAHTQRLHDGGETDRRRRAGPPRACPHADHRDLAALGPQERAEGGRPCRRSCGARPPRSLSVHRGGARRTGGGVACRWPRAYFLHHPATALTRPGAARCGCRATARGVGSRHAHLGRR